MHIKNRHTGRYDFNKLIEGCPELAKFVTPNPHGDHTIDFSDPEAVKALNRALLAQFYGVTEWDIPAGYLCPPIPGRADYVHYVAELLGSFNGGVIPRGGAIRVLDVGVGANLIYPIIGHREYGWRYTGTDIDPVALASARKIAESNAVLRGAVELRLQKSPPAILEGVLGTDDEFDLSMCNPPFHGSPEEALEGNSRKRRNLGLKGAPLNFGGQNVELWCPGGEAEFIRRMIEESAEYPTRVFWYTTLVSKESNLQGIARALVSAGATGSRKLNMTQGQKKSRIVAWTFLTEVEQSAWRKRRWAKAR